MGRSNALSRLNAGISSSERGTISTLETRGRRENTPPMTAGCDGTGKSEVGAWVSPFRNNAVLSEDVEDGGMFGLQPSGAATGACLTAAGFFSHVMSED